MSYIAYLHAAYWKGLPHSASDFDLIVPLHQ